MESFKLKPFYSRHDPLRLPNWRHTRVMAICARGKNAKCSSRDDDITKRYKKFYLAQKKLENSGKAELYRGDTDIAIASELYWNRSHSNHALLLEARLLAGYDNQRIATFLGTLPSAVHAYEQLFFNVRDRFACTDWIMSSVLFPSIIDSPQEFGEAPFDRGAFASSFYDVTLKYFSYFYGQEMCEFMIHGARRDLRLRSQEDVLQFIEEDYKHKLYRRGVMAVHMLPLNAYNATEILGAFNQVMALRASMDDEEREKSQMHQNIKTFLESVPWSVGTPEGGKHSALSAYQNKAAELRVEEQLRLGVGEEYDFSHLDDIDLPEEKGQNTVDQPIQVTDTTFNG